METFSKLIADIDAIVWGPVTIIALLGTGVYLTILLKGIQFRELGHALYLGFIKRKEEGMEGEISHFQALMTALAGTVGTGNIAGVAGAIAVGGPGALFWMWMTGLFGMASKYAEALLAVKYREQDNNGEYIGGPMFYLEKGLKNKFLAVLFAIFTVIASFGIGNAVQSAEVTKAINLSFGLNMNMVGIVLALMTAAVILGGIKNIGRVASAIVPTMILLYVVGAMVIILMNANLIIPAFATIFKYAFTPHSIIGGGFGAMLSKTIQKGVARGLFSNESGMGSSAIAAAAAKSSNPKTQALVSMTQTFIDTIVVCTMTGLVIVMSGKYNEGLKGASLTNKAFETLMPGTWGGLIVTISLIFFAYSTILGWSYYGEKAMEYLLGKNASAKKIKTSVMIYRLFYCFVVYFGAVASADLVWNISDIANALMVYPNLIGLVFLSKVVLEESNREI